MMSDRYCCKQMYANINNNLRICSIIKADVSMSVKPGEVHPGWITVSLLRTVIILLLALVLIMTAICPIISH